MAGYHVVNFHTEYRASKHFEIFATLDNPLNAKYATYGILSDPTGIGAPGIPPNGVTNGPGVDNRFQSPAAPFSAYGESASVSDTHRGFARTVDSLRRAPPSCQPLAGSGDPRTSKFESGAGSAINPDDGDPLIPRH
jgi:hypothetical protein